MGTKRVGLARAEALIENLKRELDLSSSSISGLKALAGSTSSATAHSTSVQLEEALVQLVTSGNNSHKVRMFSASTEGQLVLICSIGTHDAVIRNAGDSGTLVTLGETSKGCILVSTAAGDNWKVAAVNN